MQVVRIPIPSKGINDSRDTLILTIDLIQPVDRYVDCLPTVDHKLHDPIPEHLPSSVFMLVPTPLLRRKLTGRLIIIQAHHKLVP